MKRRKIGTRTTCTNLLERLCNIWPNVFGAIIVVTCLLLVFVDQVPLENYWVNAVPYSNAVIMWVAVPILLLVGYCLYRLSRFETGSRKFYGFLTVFFIVVLVVQLDIGARIWFLTDWDVAHVRTTSENMVKNGIICAFDELNWYYSMYPNNIFPTLLLALFHKIGTYVCAEEPYFFTVVMNIVFVWFSVFLGTICTYRITRNQPITVFAAIVGAILICFSGWIVIPYTDTLAMPFPVLAIACFLFVKNKYAKTALISLFAAIGYLLKPTVLIILMAYCILYFCKWLIDAIQKNVRLKELLVTVCLVVCITLSVTALQNNTPISAYLNENAQFGMSHYLMMGANPERCGLWSQEDVTYTACFPDVQSRTQGNIEKFLERIEQMGPSGVARLMRNKLLLTYNNGNFSWGAEGTFFITQNPDNSPLSKFLQEVYYNNLGDRKNQIFLTVQHGIWLAVLVAICGLVFCRKEDKNVSLVALSLLGVTLFLLIFECRARYLYVFSPLFIILMGSGLQSWMQKLKHNGTVCLEGEK